MGTFPRKKFHDMTDEAWDELYGRWISGEASLKVLADEYPVTLHSVYARSSSRNWSAGRARHATEFAEGLARRRADEVGDWLFNIEDPLKTEILPRAFEEIGKHFDPELMVGNRMSPRVLSQLAQAAKAWHSIARLIAGETTEEVGVSNWRDILQKVHDGEDPVRATLQSDEED